MGKHYIRTAMMLAALAGVFACGHQDPEEAGLSKTEKKERTAINTFAYNVMSTYYLWNEEISSGLESWTMLTDPVKKVQEIRYKDRSGKDIDRWTMLTDDIESLISSTGGVSTTYGMDFKLYYYDESKKEVCMVVTLVYPDSPASNAGIKRGDIFMKVGGKQLTESNYSTLLNDSFFHAKSCTLSDLQGKEYGMTAVEMYENPVLVRKVFDLGDRKVGYLFFNSFTLAACSELAEAGRYFRSEGIESLILDLRYNGGGYVLTETLLASLLAPEAEVKAGSVFETAVYNSTIADAWGDEETCFAQSFTISQGNDKFTIDISDANMGISHLYAIMTEDSASASESLIVGLLPYMDVKIFGQQSHGKFCSGIMYSAKDWYKDYDDVLKDEQRELGNQFAGMPTSTAILPACLTASSRTSRSKTGPLSRTSSAMRARRCWPRCWRGCGAVKRPRTAAPAQRESRRMRSARKFRATAAPLTAHAYCSSSKSRFSGQAAELTAWSRRRCRGSRW